MSASYLNRRISAAAIVVAILAVATTAFAATATFQQDTVNTFYPLGYTLTHDNQILTGGFEGDNVGGRNSMQLGTGSPNGQRRLIVRFDGLDAMAGSYLSIDSARLVLRKASGIDQQYPQRVDVDLFAISDANAGWNEGNGQFAPAAPGESSWNFRAQPAGWAGSPGLSTAGTDHSATALDTVNMGADQAPNTIYNFDVPTSLVEQWITGINAGLFLRFQNEALGNAIEVYSSEFGGLADAPVRPALIIEYTPIPEPTALSVLALAGIALKRRK